MEIAEFAAWARRPAKNVVVMADEAERLSPKTVNRMLTGVVGFYELQASTVADDLVVKTRGGRGGYKPFLHGIARSRPRGRAVRLPEQRSLPHAPAFDRAAVNNASSLIRRARLIVSSIRSGSEFCDRASDPSVRATPSWRPPRPLPDRGAHDCPPT
jgi:hypothetical protein